MAVQPAPTFLNIGDEIARYLGAQSVTFTYTVDGTSGGNVYLGVAPADVDVAVQVKVFGDGPVSERIASTKVVAQFTCRALSTVAAHDLAAEVFDLLHAMTVSGSVTLPGGAKVLHAYAVQHPIDLGLDDQDRYEYSVNIALEFRAITTHRAPL